MRDDDQILALQALAWILSDEPRRERLLGMTGLTPDALRASLGEPAVMGAILQFLAGHEDDLIACADATGISAQSFGAAARRLEQAEGWTE
ncbi:DUF3572 domain-containing protein [Sphingopyxis yananensis]|uniref:DUF3572 domain-containing protein n=1 Tax=Sphingopyxis yananensis TaxID=2886687 RepID=UPI001D10A4B2|nr:DUF3572 domain-containing protein [Sphingopyxis yananensis]MCC2601325.1 DUF3572 domain-containing protein [Sphingopyxis yananensis]